MTKILLTAAVFFSLCSLTLAQNYGLKNSSQGIYDRFGRYQGKVQVNKYNVAVYNNYGMLTSRTYNRTGSTFDRYGRYQGRNYHYKIQKYSRYQRQSQGRSNYGYSRNQSKYRYQYQNQYQRPR